MNERLKKLRKTLDMTQQEFADRIGIKRNSLANYETGRNTPIDAIIVSICREFNVNEEWLREGKGEMFIKMTRDEEIATFIEKALHSEEDSFKKRLISALGALNEADWETLENEIDKFVPKTSGDELTIILYCDKGTISLLTGRDLSLKGYNVISLKGGYDGLKEKL